MKQKILIEGDISKEETISICKFLHNMYNDKKELIIVLLKNITEDMTPEESLDFSRRIVE